MLSLRSLWLFVASYLTLGVTLAPLPLLGCAGGLIKVVSYMNAGAIFALHLLLLLGYAGLYKLNVVKSGQLKTPARISTFALIVTAIPVVLALATCSPDWLQEQATRPVSLQNLLAYPKGWTVQQWTSLVKPCPGFDAFPNMKTSTFRTNLPVRGPSSLEAPFMNSITSLVMAGLGNFNQTELNTYYFPVPEEHQTSSDKKPGLLIFVHGGGWWSGAAELVPGGCHAMFAHANGWAYAAVEYRLGRTGWSGDVQLSDVKDAIQHVLTKYSREVDLSRVIVIGSSAGANLGLAAAYQLNNKKTSLKDPTIRGVVAIAPSTSVEIGMSQDSVPRWRGAWDEAEATTRFCEGVKDCHKKLSPIEHVTQYTPPTIVLHGLQDEYYTPLHSRALMERLAQHRIPHVHLEPPLMGHCLELAENILPYQMVRSALLDLMNSL